MRSTPRLLAVGAVFVVLVAITSSVPATVAGPTMTIAAPVPTAVAAGPMGFRALQAAAGSLRTGAGPAGGTSVGCAYTSAGGMECLPNPARQAGRLPQGPNGTRPPGWYQVNSGPAPGARTFAAMTYDPDLKAVVLFGGYNVSVFPYNDTWTFANGSWTNITSKLGSAPPARWAASLAYDAYDGYVVLFGGRRSSTFYNDTWKFNGTAWTQLTPTSAPPPRAQGLLVYDSGDQYLVLFAGYDNVVGRTYNDTWTFRSGSWTNITNRSAPAPPVVNGGGMAYDARDGYAVFFGGARPSSCVAAFNSTWSFSGGRWTNRTAVLRSSPPPRGGGFSMGYDPTLQAVVLFGGQALSGSACNALNETWVYQHGNWTNVSSALFGAPSARCCDPLASDPGVKGTLVFGGNGGASNPTPNYLGDTWALETGTTFLPQFRAAPTSGMRPLTVKASVAPVLGLAPYTESWSFGDGSPNASGTSVSHTYSSVGRFSLNVTVQDANGTTISISRLINVYNGSWTDLTSWSTAPPARAQAALAYDPSSSAVLLFGGLEYGSTAYADTWSFSDGNWTNLTAGLTPSPPARWGASMVYDTIDRQVLLFGGHDGSTNYNDTWEYSAATGWVQLALTVAPSPRAYSVLLDDSTDGYVLLFGGTCRQCGSSGQDVHFNDTWAFRSGIWTNDTTRFIGAPPAAAFSGAYDPSDGYGLLYGSNVGANCSGPSLTWTFSAGSWTNRTATSGGPPTSPQTSAVAFDPSLGGVVLFGGYYPSGSVCSATNTTWLFSHGGWSNVTANYSSAPSGRCCAALTYDYANGMLTLFGGNEAPSQSTGYLSDTWAFPGTPMSVATSTAPSGGDAPLSVTFGATPRGGLWPYSASWEFGDGAPNGTGLTVTHNYSVAGTYGPVVTVTDARGRIARIELSIQVYGHLTVTAGTATSVVERPYPIDFQSSVSGGRSPFTYDWGFGDGQSSTSPNPSHVYSALGNYTAHLTVRDGFNQLNVSAVNVTVLPALNAVATVLPLVGDVPMAVHANGSVSGGVAPYSEHWDFGDGSLNVSGTTAVHDYSTPGTFNVVYSVTDALGYQFTSRTTILVEAALAASIVASPSSGVAPLPVLFSASVSGGTGPLNESWAFGDGGTAYGTPSASHTYARAGNYTAELVVTDAAGSTQRATYSVVVVAPLSVHPSASGAEGPAPYRVVFSAGDSGGLGPLSYSWSFGDGTAGSNVADPTHTFTAIGSHQVEVKVIDALNEVATASITVLVIAPLAVSLNVGMNPVPVGSNASFHAQVAGGTSPVRYRWTGLPASCSTPDAAFVSCLVVRPGPLTVAVTVTDPLNESASANATVNVSAPPTNPAGPLRPGFPGGTLGLALLVAAVAVAILVGALVLRRRERRAGMDDPVEDALPLVEADGESPREPDEPPS